MIRFIIKFIKFIVPIKYYATSRQIYNAICWPLYIYRDYRHFLITDQRYKKITVLSQIIQESHRLEKAISNPSFVQGRGRSAAYALMAALKSAYSQSIFDIQYHVGNSIISTFLDLQDGSQEWVIILRNELKILNNGKYDAIGGVKNFSFSDRTDISGSSFQKLASFRSSIRVFSQDPVDICDIRRAAAVAQKTPSVCNRQGWRLFVTFDSSLIDLFRFIHKGFSNTSDQPLHCLLVVTFSKASFRYPKERNQGYIDASLYAMSLIYALTDLGLATCPLNANLTFHNEDLLRKAFHIDTSYGIVMFIAVGHFLPDNTVPVSYRYTADDVIEMLTIV